ncbi:hypothetical protein [Nocardioides sp. WS12]|uniref:hypothetical protein n=1 Tax=Nocardioides sp. WS12 TaxID=2486272 RepID=UPI0015FA3D14|nr:hypothetical protein [Nocardioides sp. WS12]
MSSPKKAAPTPHRFDCDLASLEGITVLGESAAVLFSVMLRLEFGPARDGMAAMSATVPASESEALKRAMTRAERDVPGDRRTRGQRDHDRFLTVVERVGEVIDALDHQRGAA